MRRPGKHRVRDDFAELELKEGRGRNTDRDSFTELGLTAAAALPIADVVLRSSFTATRVSWNNSKNQHRQLWHNVKRYEKTHYFTASNVQTRS